MPHATDASQPLPLPDTLQFMRMLWGLSHALDRASKQMAGTIGVTGPQRLVLRVVGLRPGVSAGDLAGTLHVHPSTLTGVLQRLVAQRLLLRTPDRRDRRRAILQLTARGARVNLTTAGTVEGAITRAITAIHPRDRASCQRVISRIVQQLDANTTRRGPRSDRPRTL